MLITGATGHLGRNTMRRAAAAGWDVVGTCFRTPADGAEPLDIRDREAVHRLARRLRPEIVVHTAAGRDDWAVMADGAAHVAIAAVRTGARLVHLSSEALFAGRDTEYDEDDQPDPVYRYGAAKAAAETAVRAVDPTAAIVRTSVILGDGGGAHELLTHDLIAGRRQGVLPADQIRKPVHVHDLADALLELAVNGHRGVLNVAGADVVDRYELGVLVAERDGLDPALIPKGRVADLGPALPVDVRLCTDRARALLRTRLRGAREFLRKP
jgi:dTDP-4-dehydrorhamnose reductase